MRVTRLQANGAVAPGPNNSYVSNTQITVSLNAEIQEGEDREVVTGCDCLCLTYKGPDKLKRWNIEAENCRIEPPLMELLLGWPIVPGVPPDFIGNVFSDDLDCSYQNNGVAIEFWADAWDSDAQLPSPYRYWHWLFTRVTWQIGDHELQNDFMNVNLKGWTKSNTNFGDPYADQPAGLPTVYQGAYWLTDTIPDAACAYATI